MSSSSRRLSEITEKVKRDRASLETSLVSDRLVRIHELEREVELLTEVKEEQERDLESLLATVSSLQVHAEAQRAEIDRLSISLEGSERENRSLRSAVVAERAGREAAEAEALRMRKTAAELEATLAQLAHPLFKLQTVDDEQRELEELLEAREREHQRLERLFEEQDRLLREKIARKRSAFGQIFH
jgi:hypothetical protein